MNEIKLRVTFERHEWIKLNFMLAYRMPLTILLTLVGMAQLCVIIFYFALGTDLMDMLPVIGFCFFCLVGWPCIIFVYVNKTFTTIGYEEMNYTFNDVFIKAEGVVVIFEIDWNNTRSIQERKDWYLIFIESHSGFFIPKNRFKNKEEEMRFREMLKSKGNCKI